MVISSPIIMQSMSCVFCFFVNSYPRISCACGSSCAIIMLMYSSTVIPFTSLIFDENSSGSCGSFIGASSAIFLTSSFVG